MRLPIFLILLFCLSFCDLSAQHKETERFVFRRNDDQRKIAFGYFLGLRAFHYHLRFTESFTEDRQASIVSETRPGFALGFNGAYRFNPLWELTLQPQVSFNEVGFTKVGSSVSETQQNQLITRVGLPVMVSYKSLRRGNFRMFMNAGVTAELDPIGKKSKKSGDYIEMSSSDVKLNVGFGLTRYYPLFNFSPELRFSYGLINQFTDVDNELSADISAMYSRSVSLIFNIGG